MKQYVVDAFTDRVFSGNPAAVCFPDEWPTSEVMLNIARENRFSETAFVVREGEKYHLRWFTPGSEIDLCGHATLAAAFALFTFYDRDAPKLVFDTQSGDLIATRGARGRIELQFPAYALTKVSVDSKIIDAFGKAPTEAYLGRDLLCVFDDEGTVRRMAPDSNKLWTLPGALVHATAPGAETDCVSRSFAPKFGIREDPVCGSGHCHIAPYWSRRLGKKEIVAYQASDRGGTLYCRVEGDVVYLSGAAALFSTGEIFVES